MADKYTLDEVNAILDVAEKVQSTLNRIGGMSELKARLVCPHCRCYDKEVWDQVVLHGVPCRVTCMRGLSQWIEEEAVKLIRAQHFAKQDDAPSPAAVGPDDWHMCGPGEQLK